MKASVLCQFIGTTFTKTCVILFLFLIQNCKKKEAYVYVCKDGNVDFEILPDLRYFQNLKNAEDSLSTLVIRTDVDYRKYLVNPTRAINFAEKTLLCGRLHGGTPGKVISQTLKSYCISREIFCDVQIKVNDSGAAVEADTRFFLLINKIPETTHIRFNVHH